MLRVGSVPPQSHRDGGETLPNLQPTQVQLFPWGLTAEAWLQASARRWLRGSAEGKGLSSRGARPR